MIVAASAAALTGVALVVALAAAVQLSAGFGFGLAAVPLLAVAIDPHDAVVVALTLATITNGYQALSDGTPRIARSWRACWPAPSSGCPSACSCSCAPTSGSSPRSSASPCSSRSS